MDKLDSREKTGIAGTLAATIVLALALSCFIVLQPASSAYADYGMARESLAAGDVKIGMSTQSLKSGSFEYKVNKSGTVTITKYTGSENVTSLEIPKYLGGKLVTSIGENAIANHYKLKKVSLPSSITTIGSAAFYGCPIKNLKLPQKVKRMGWFAFGYTSCVTIPKTMKAFEWRCFVSGDGTCTLSKIKIEKGSKYFSFKDGVLYNKDKTRLVYYLPSNSYSSFAVPDSVQTIDQFAFDYCFGLENVTLGKNVTTLKQGAFIGTNVGYSLTLPERMKNLGPSSLSFFGGTKVLYVKTKKLTARSVKDCLKNSSVTTIYVNVGDRKTNQKFADKYNRIFTYSNAGKYVSVYAY